MSLNEPLIVSIAGMKFGSLSWVSLMTKGTGIRCSTTFHSRTSGSRAVEMRSRSIPAGTR